MINGVLGSRNTSAYATGNIPWRLPILPSYQFSSTCRSNVTSSPYKISYMSRVMRKPAFSIYKNKGADQLRVYHAADQRLCFCFIDVQSLFYLNPNFQASSNLLCLYSPVCVRLIGNLKTGFLMSQFARYDPHCSGKT